MATITALHINKYGPISEVYSSVIPKPAISNDSEVLIKVVATAAHPADALFISNNYNQKAKSFPSRVGFEGAGIVEAAGKTATVKEGQRVHFIALGAWAEYIVVDTAANPPVPIPDQLSYEDAAQLTINPLTVIGLLDTLNPKEGEFVVQNAASSALARIVVQIAKAKGFKTINIVRREEHVETLKAIGADFVINSEKEDVSKRIFEISPGGVKYGLDAVGGEGGALLVKVLSEEGILVNYGVLGGLTLEVDLSALLFKSLTVKGFYLYKWTSNRGKQQLAKDFEYLITSILTKKLVLPIQTFDGKTQYAEGLKHSQTPGKSEKTILLF